MGQSEYSILNKEYSIMKFKDGWNCLSAMLIYGRFLTGAALKVEVLHLERCGLCPYPAAGGCGAKCELLLCACC